MSRSDCQCFGLLGLQLYAQGVSLDAGSPMLIEIIALECQKIVFRGGGFVSLTSPFQCVKVAWDMEVTVAVFRHDKVVEVVLVVMVAVLCCGCCIYLEYATHHIHSWS